MKLIPLACSLRTESEFAGRVRVKFVPALLITLVTGKTLVGAASEFSSVGLQEVNWMSVAVGATELSPLRLNVVATGTAEALTVLTRISRLALA